MMTDIPFPIFILLAALLADVLVVFLWLVVREVAPRWNGMRLRWEIEIFKSEKGNV